MPCELEGRPRLLAECKMIKKNDEYSGKARTCWRHAEGSLSGHVTPAALDISNGGGLSYSS